MFQLSKELQQHIIECVTLLEDMGVAKGFGFKRYHSTYRRLQAYHNKSLGVVVKRPACILDDRTPKKLRVPTIALGGGWVVQPIVSKVNLARAAEIIRRRAKPYQKFKIFPDIHTGNVGWYQGKAVLFDW